MIFSKNSKTMRSFTRIVSLVLLHTFLLSGITFAAPQEKTPELNQKEIVTNPDNIVIPRELGLVKSKYIADSGKIIIHIQDAHCNYEAQSNIAKILEALIKNDGLKFVAVEGADGAIDTSWFKAFPDDAVRKEVADYFMKKGEITGPEFLSITTDYPIKLFGAETRAYYLQNLNAFTSSYSLKAETEKYFGTIKSALNKLKEFIYNDDLKLIDAKVAEYEAKKLQFNEYVRFLQSEAEKNKINLRGYENLFKLVNVLIYEKKIDFNVTDKERSDLIDEITKKLTKEGVTQLVTQSISFKLGKISSADYYNHLKNLANANGIDLAKNYQNLYNYIIYNSVYSKIENEKLFRDITAVEGAIKEKLFKNDDQRTLEKLSRHIDTLIGLVNIKLLNSDFDYYKNHKEEFGTEAFADFIQKKAAQFGLAMAVEPPADAVTKSISKLEDFYAIAIRRDKALVDNTLNEMKRADQRIAVLVTGGFHSEGIAKLLEKEGISYMIVCPSITKDVPTPYIQVLTNQRTSFEDIVMGAAEPAQQGMLAPASIAWAVGLNEKEVRKVYQNVLKASAEASLEGTLEGRVLRVKNWWIVSHLTVWMNRAFRYINGNLHRIGQQEDVMREAYIMALDYRLSNLVKDGVLAQGRAEEVKARITGSKNFNEEFHRAFVLAQSSLPAREVISQAAERKAPDTSDRAKTIGLPLTDDIIDESIRTADKWLAIFQNGEVPAGVPPQYAWIIDMLRDRLNGLSDDEFEIILRDANVAPGSPLAKAFNKENLFKVLEKGYGKDKKGFTIKLVQPRQEVEGVAVPGLVMSAKGSNFGHFSVKNNTAYIPWTLVDLLLANMPSKEMDAEALIVGDIAHELAEFTVFEMAYPDGVIGLADAKDITLQAHNIAQQFEIMLTGQSMLRVDSRLGPRSALDNILEDINARYFSELAAKKRGDLSTEEARRNEENHIAALIEAGIVAYANIMGEQKKREGYALSLENLGSLARINSIISDNSIISEKEREMVAKLIAFGKGSVFMFWEELTNEQKKKLIEQLGMIDHDAAQREYKKYIFDRVEDPGATIVITKDNVSMPKMVDLREDSQENQDALKVGEEAYRNGEVGNLLMAGGSGARLGYPAPKVMFEASQIMLKTLGRMQTETLYELGKEYGWTIPWEIMTSDVTDKKIQEYLDRHTTDKKLFDRIDRSKIRTDRQRIKPVFDSKGRYVLGGTQDESQSQAQAKEWAKYHIAVSGFGHGDARDYILRNPDVGAVKWFTDQGVRYVMANNVDNAFMVGPRALGHHIRSGKNLKPGTEHMSMVVVEKIDPEDSVGMVVLINNKNGVLEYSQVPEEAPYLPYIYADPDGKEKFILYKNDAAQIQIVSFDNFEKIFRDEVVAKGPKNKKAKDTWVAQHCLSINRLPDNFIGHFMGKDYKKDMLARETKLWLRFGNINTLIWTLPSLNDSEHQLNNLPVIVERGKAQDGYHPETGEYVPKKDGKGIYVDKLEIKAFDGFRRDTMHGAVILVDRDGKCLEGGFADIKNSTGKSSPQTAKKSYIAHDTYLLTREDLTSRWYISPEAKVELSAAFTFIDGRRMEGRIGEGGKIGKSAEVYLSGRNTSIGKEFNINDNINFRLRFENEENEKAKAIIGDNVRVKASMAFVIHGSGQLIIDDGIIFNESKEIVANDGEIVRVVQNITEVEQEQKITAQANDFWVERGSLQDPSGAKEDWEKATLIVRKEYPLYKVFKINVQLVEAPRAERPNLEVFSDGSIVDWNMWEPVKGVADIIRQKTDNNIVALKHDGVWNLASTTGFVGAIRMNGKGLSAAEHGTRDATVDIVRDEASFNGAAASLIEAGNAYALVKNYSSIKLTDIDIPQMAPDLTMLSDIQLGNLRRLMNNISSLKINFVIIKGLKEELVRRDVATDVIFHPGITRRAVYLDEADLLYLLSLSNGAELLEQAINHEIAHIMNPDLSEAKIEKMAPTSRVRRMLPALESKRRDAVLDNPAIDTRTGDALASTDAALKAVLSRVSKMTITEERLASYKAELRKNLASVLRRDIEDPLVTGAFLNVNVSTDPIWIVQYGIDADNVPLVAVMNILNKDVLAVGIRAESWTAAGSALRTFDKTKGPSIYLLTSSEVIDMSGATTVLTPIYKTGIGAIRLNGGALTVVEHGTRGALNRDIRNERSVNGAIAELIKVGHAYALTALNTILPEDMAIDVKDRPRTNNLNRTQLDNFAALRGVLENIGINFVVITGLRDELIKRGVAPDLVFHPGMTRHAVYVDEADLLYLLAAPNGLQLVQEAINHEMAHIRYPNASEYEIEFGSKERSIIAAPTYNIRLALTLRSIAAERAAVQTENRRYEEGGIYNYVDAENARVAGMYERPLKKFAKFGTSGVRWLVPGSLKTLAEKYPETYRYIYSNGYVQEDFNIPNVGIIAKAIALYNLRKVQGLYAPVLGTTTAFQERLKNKGILLTYDNRPANLVYAKTIARILAAYGIKVTMVKTEGQFAASPIPVTSLMVKREGYAGAITLTASHNGDQWNGVKYETEDGAPAALKTTDAIGAILTEELRLKEPNYDITTESVDELIAKGKIESVNAIDYYVNTVLEYLGKERLDRIKQAIKEGKVSLNYSAFFGSSGMVMKRLFEKLGLPVNDIMETQKTREDIFVESYEPTLEKLTALNQAVQKAGQAAVRQARPTIVLGAAADNDADRFQVCEYNPATGKVEEFAPAKLTAILGHYLVKSRKLEDKVAIPGKPEPQPRSWGRSFVSSTYQDYAAKLFGHTTMEEATGFKFSPDTLANGGVIYSEESYGLSFNGWTLDKDGILPALLVLELVANTGKSLTQYDEELKAELKAKGLRSEFFFDRDDLKLTEDIKTNAIKRFTEFFNKIDVNKTTFAGQRIVKKYDPKLVENGMKFVLENGSWVAFRSSGTEPIIRLYMEALTEEQAQGLRKELLRLTGLDEKPALSDIEKEKKETPKKADIKAAKITRASMKGGEGKASPEIYEKYIREDEEALRSTLVAISVDEQRRKRPAIIVYDTGIEPESISAVQAGEAAVKQYLGGTLEEVRGTGKALLEKIRTEAQAMAARLQCNVSDIAIVSIIGDDSRKEIEQELVAEAIKLRKEGKAGTSLQDELGKIINVAPNEKSKYVPVIALYDIALRWAYGLDLQQIADRLSRFAANTTDPNGGPFTVKDLEKGIIRILPRIGPVNTADAVEAYKAAQQALQSL